MSQQVTYLDEFEEHNGESYVLFYRRKANIGGFPFHSMQADHINLPRLWNKCKPATGWLTLFRLIAHAHDNWAMNYWMLISGPIIVQLERDDECIVDVKDSTVEEHADDQVSIQNMYYTT
jgi:hypothetical protein